MSKYLSISKLVHSPMLYQAIKVLCPNLLELFMQGKQWLPSACLPPYLPLIGERHAGTSTGYFLSRLCKDNSPHQRRCVPSAYFGGSIESGRVLSIIYVASSPNH